ncbi:MAG: tetratricopeptide repeat protein, partial [Acidimicrobiia bacterium]|nr:tetratricopeptide repeat protein [Acidimicrobiia bacterium]
QLGSYPASTRPVEHATLQFNLGLALSESPTGDRLANLKAAVTAHAEALSLFDSDRYPLERARVLTALGAAERELGMPAVARDRFVAARSLADPVAAPAEHGAATNNLGLAFTALGQFSEAEEALKEALDSFAGPDYFRQRLATLHNLGQAQAAQATSESLDRAIATYRAAIDQADPGQHAYVYAMLNQSLALAHLSYPSARSQHLDHAITACHDALTVFVKRSYPFQHAVVKNNLGVAHLEQPHDRLDHLRKAMACFEDALGIFDPRLHRVWWEEARANLAKTDAALRMEGATATRPEHFAALAGAQAPSARLDLLRARLRDLLDLPEPRRSEALAALDHAFLRRPAIELEGLATSWMQVLLEQPDDQLQTALAVRLSEHQLLDPAQRQAALAAFETAVGDLEVLQRMRIRTLAGQLGYVRPEGR